MKPIKKYLRNQYLMNKVFDFINISMFIYIILQTIWFGWESNRNGNWQGGEGVLLTRFAIQTVWSESRIVSTKSTLLQQVGRVCAIKQIIIISSGRGWAACFAYFTNKIPLVSHTKLTNDFFIFCHFSFCFIFI